MGKGMEKGKYYKNIETNMVVKCIKVINDIKRFEITIRVIYSKNIECIGKYDTWNFFIRSYNEYNPSFFDLIRFQYNRINNQIKRIFIFPIINIFKKIKFIYFLLSIIILELLVIICKIN